MRICVDMGRQPAHGKGLSQIPRAFLVLINFHTQEQKDKLLLLLETAKQIWGE